MAVTGQEACLAALDRDIYAAWSAGDSATYNQLEAQRSAIEQRNRESADAIASTPLGLLLLRKVITKDQYRAADLYEANQIYLGKAIAGPQRPTKAVLANFLAQGSSVYYGLDDLAFEAAKFARLRWVEREIAARVADWRQLDRIVVERGMPPLAWLADLDETPQDLKTFIADLTAIVRFYEHPPKREDSRHPMAKRRKKVAA